MTCLICSCTPPLLTPPKKIISPSWIWLRLAPALCLFPRLPVGLLLRLCGSSHAGLSRFALSFPSPPSLLMWTNWTFPFRWRVFFSGRQARHYEMCLCYLKFKLGWITDSDVMFGSIFNLGSDTTAGLAPVLRLIIIKVHRFERDKNIFPWATCGPCLSHLCGCVLSNSTKS